eukprot:15469757-Alexandrium_andersonii.AAC.1
MPARCPRDALRDALEPAGKTTPPQMGRSRAIATRTPANTRKAHGTTCSGVSRAPVSGMTSALRP